jgi:hypothetical protein
MASIMFHQHGQLPFLDLMIWEMWTYSFNVMIINVKTIKYMNNITMHKSNKSSIWEVQSYHNKGFLPFKGLEKVIFVS